MESNTDTEGICPYILLLNLAYLDWFGLASSTLSKPFEAEEKYPHFNVILQAWLVSNIIPACKNPNLIPTCNRHLCSKIPFSIFFFSPKRGNIHAIGVIFQSKRP